ncbi:hypothetical protein GU243_10485 [Pseudarthrobacter psychrotolerans]|uniref:Uncharacterized protein n=1 Tax=Pseudarthrobacter psychrotolerans TaxID=2697569 RepID=A0A6P1NL86_9MICC|nr:hypothetical protein [Pseudarthrobacter psychrotolerans]QHK20088.1 hypothetical protein GU243_10485 [Pseudarthrobacter psychrotolerans]
MKAAAVAVSVVLASSLLAGCTAGAPPGSRPSDASGVVLTSGSGSELGNGRPQVSYDGLMVRRRIVVAIHPAPDADMVALSAALSSAAGSLGLAVSPISPDVLGANVLQHTVPELIVALPSDATIDDGGKLVNLAFGQDLAFPGLDHIHVAQVLVHDLRFTVSSANPGALAEAIALEGILADALGNYDTHASDGELELGYTGPLLSDTTVEAVRLGVARAAGNTPDDVKVAPRSGTGTGVDMDKEPADASVAANPVHGH